MGVSVSVKGMMSLAEAGRVLGVGSEQVRRYLHIKERNLCPGPGALSSGYVL